MKRVRGRVSGGGIFTASLGFGALQVMDTSPAGRGRDRDGVTRWRRRAIISAGVCLGASEEEPELTMLCLRVGHVLRVAGRGSRVRLR